MSMDDTHKSDKKATNSPVDHALFGHALEAFRIEAEQRGLEPWRYVVYLMHMGRQMEKMMLESGGNDGRDCIKATIELSKTGDCLSQLVGIMLGISEKELLDDMEAYLKMKKEEATPKTDDISFEGHGKGEA